MKNEWKDDSEKENDKGVERERERERRKEKAKQKAPEKEGSGLSRREEGSSASPNKASVCERRC